MSHSFLQVTGIHATSSTSTPPPFYGDWLPEFYRHPQSWSRRTDEMVVTANAEGVDAFLSMGDEVDQGDLRATRLSNLVTLDVKFNTLSMPWIRPMSNHIIGAFNGIAGAPTIEDYFTQTNAEMVTVSDPFPDASHAYQYYVDISGIRYIIAYNPNTGTDMETAPDPGGTPRDWLQDLDDKLTEADDLNLSVIIIGHAHLWFNPQTPITGWVDTNNVANPETVQAVFDAHPCVQMVLGGHDHQGRQWKFANGIWYIDGLGSIDLRRGEESTGNAYQIVEFEPKAMMTKFGRKARLLGVTPFGYSITQNAMAPSYEPIYGIGA